MLTKAIVSFYLFLQLCILTTVSFAQPPIYNPRFAPMPGVYPRVPTTPMPYARRPAPMVPYTQQTYPRFRQPMRAYPQYPQYQQPRQYQQPKAGYRQIPKPMVTPRPQTTPPPLVAKVQAPVNEFSGYLGIILDKVPSSVAAQLPKEASPGQGILIKDFAPNSPSETSDLKPFDVIIAYQDVKLHHPSQFIKLVRNEKPGRQVNLKVVRKGEIMDIPVTLGAQKTPNPKAFNSVLVKSTGKNDYKASVRFIGPNGNKQFRSYEGTREELLEKALNARDLPLEEREQLLRALRSKKGKSNSGMGSFMPFGTNESGKDWMNPGKFFKW